MILGEFPGLVKEGHAVSPGFSWDTCSGGNQMSYKKYKTTKLKRPQVSVLVDSTS